MEYHENPEGFYYFGYEIWLFMFIIPAIQFILFANIFIIGLQYIIDPIISQMQIAIGTGFFAGLLFLIDWVVKSCEIEFVEVEESE